MTTDTLTLSAFLLERIEDDEGTAYNALMRRDMEAEDDEPWRLWWQDVPSRLCVQPARVLATCKAHRAIVEPWASGDGAKILDLWADSPELDPPIYIANALVTLRALASVYADHADYDARWAL